MDRASDSTDDSCEHAARDKIPSIPSPTPAHDIITLITNNTGLHDPVTYLSRPLHGLLPFAQHIGARVVAAASTSKLCAHGLFCVVFSSGFLLIYHRLQSLENRIEDLLISN